MCKTDNTCEFCSGESVRLGEFIVKNVFNDLILFGLTDSTELTVGLVREHGIDDEQLQLEIRNSSLMVFKSDDANCEDAALLKIKINYCPICGKQL